MVQMALKVQTCLVTLKVLPVRFLLLARVTLILPVDLKAL